LSNVKDNARRMTIETVLVDNMERLGVNVVRRLSVPINADVFRFRHKGLGYRIELLTSPSNTPA